MLLIIGNQFGDYQDDICGAVVSRRKRGDKITLWTRHGNDEASCKAIGSIWKKGARISLPIQYSVRWGGSGKGRRERSSQPHIAAASCVSLQQLHTASIEAQASYNNEAKYKL